MNNSPYVLIMAGGVGSRFWPASREHLPKQFLDITGSGKSLIRATVDRFLKFIPIENIFVITHKDYGRLVKSSIPELSADQIIEEPSRNNTAASIALASMKLHKRSPNAICIVAPADHIIRHEDEFQRVIELATVHADQHQSLITLGIEPTRADTGYGYIEFDPNDEADIRKVKSFREKPDANTAEQYLNAESFVWNAGIFIWKLSVILDAFKEHSSQIYSLLERGIDMYNTPSEEAFIESNYPQTEKISVDYAIMERATNVYTIPCHIGWSDLGTWTSLHAESVKDDQQNALLTNSIVVEDTTNTLIVTSPEKLVVVKGLDDYIIVDTPDCLLIYPKSEEQAIKELKEKLRLSGLDQYL